MKALIVDDSSFAQRMTQKFLVKIFPDIKIVVAGNGRSGYDAFIREQPDVIFSDLLMPQMSGQEMIKEIRKVDSSVLIIVLTADVQKSTKFELIQLGITTFLNKPFTSETAELVRRKIGEQIHA